MIIKSIEEGDKKAEFVLDAMIYNVAKAIGGAATVLCGKIDAILLTGGIAYSDYVISRLKKRISFLAPIHIYPGENEMESLAFNALGALKGELPIQIYKYHKLPILEFHRFYRIDKTLIINTNQYASITLKANIWKKTPQLFFALTPSFF